ncbi:Adenylate kinase [Rubritalea squalenifaciens DSM 18772]|uniref:Adenylate kinase n=1 Tax=Rubritalea squalenifaciens DSM 18772 TaxID=1123071 RepID=A0A1M6RT74_9BACT|nr:nucleoside monophosphate kinase [Rubritalea squalenifaciens]SHK35659.1 Adenylate kinase [Rubritalea squalenifaciens DSM 18772]
MHRIVLLGPPASGKGTQSDRISSLLNIPHLSTGNILRKEVENGSPIGLEAQKYLDRGAYVPDELILSMVQAWLSERPEGWLLDGFPRTKAQAEALQNLPGVDKPTLVLGLEVPKEALISRMEGRRECSGCGKTVSITEGQKEICADCGGDLVKRSDDVIDSFKVRYQNYEELTLPLFDFYQEKGILVRIDGTQSPDAVFDQIKQHLVSEQVHGEA